jgi:hypothetical protein
MKAYNRTYNRTRAGIIASNIVLMYKAMHGKIDVINCAPSRHSLREFGGTLSIDEFRKLSEKGTRIIVNMPDELYRMQEVIIRQEVRSMADMDANHKFQEISKTGITNETLKLKRQKPLKRDENNLEKTLGIIRKNN